MYGLSLGAGTIDPKKPIMKGGKMALQLENVELYEVACM